MKTLAIAVAAGVATLAPAMAQTRAPNVISVTGEATVTATPDLATIDGGVISGAKTAREASEATNRTMAAVLAALKSSGIAETDIRTARISLQPQQSMRGPAQDHPQITGYRASNRVTVRIRDIARVASTIDTLVGAGANDIGGIDFVVTKASGLLDEARSRAIADARRKADIYAKAAGVTLGPAISITEDGASPPMPMQMRAAFKGGAGTPVSPGEETLQVSVQVSFEIRPGTP